MDLEVLAVLRDEVVRVEALMAEALTVMRNDGDANARKEATEGYREQVERIAAAANVLNLAGLARICEQVGANLAALDGGPMAEDAPPLFNEWPPLVLEYLAAPKDPKNADALTNLFMNSAWPAPLESCEGAALAQLLRDVPSETGAREMAPQRAAQAQPEDVALDIPDDVNPVLVEAFLAEGPLQAAHYSASIQRVIGGDNDIAVVNEARRVVHALKGAANTVGVRGVATLAHHLEDILEYLAEQTVRPQGALAKLLLEAADCLEMMLESLVDGSAPPASALKTLQHILDWANCIDRGELDLEADTFAEEPPPVTVSAPAVGTRAAQDVLPLKPMHAPPPPEADVKVTPRIRVPTDVIDEMLRLSGEVTISRAHIQERIHELLK
ncbi:MAG: Hpt domain-containing protein, partial [Gammaproteobacteria bacterium]|nr:Hpt domain-containing protein [Gammaproteobacteria bacterium]